MIIKDNVGGKLELSKTSLTELTGEAINGYLWYINLRTLAKTPDGEHAVIHRGKWKGAAKVDRYSNRIGCRYFDAATFNKIMRAAKRTKTATKKAKATKK